jgi:hypothetical protein
MLVLVVVASVVVLVWVLGGVLVVWVLVLWLAMT